MLGKSVSYFLSQQWSNTPLYAEKIIPLLDTCLSSNFVLSDKVADAFYELTNKYQNTADLPLENLKEFIREQGYGYILDLVVQDEKTVKLLWYMLVLIHQLKGTKEGLLLVLSLLDGTFDPAQTKIVQWHEMFPVGRANTFQLETNINIAQLGEGFFSRFQTFLSNYVYPEMLIMNINYNVDGRITYRPYARIKVYSDALIQIKDCLNGGNAEDEFPTKDSEGNFSYKYVYRTDIYNGGSSEDWVYRDENGNNIFDEQGNVYWEDDPHDYLTNVVITKLYGDDGLLEKLDIKGETVEYSFDVGNDLKQENDIHYIYGSNASLTEIKNGEYFK